MIFANGNVDAGDMVRCLNGGTRTREVAEVIDGLQPMAVLDDGRTIPETSSSIAWARIPARRYTKEKK